MSDQFNEITILESEVTRLAREVSRLTKEREYLLNLVRMAERRYRSMWFGGDKPDTSVSQEWQLLSLGYRWHPSDGGAK